MYNRCIVYSLFWLIVVKVFEELIVCSLVIVLHLGFIVEHQYIFDLFLTKE